MKKKLLAAVFGTALVLGACGGGGDDSSSEDTGSSNGGDSSVDAEAVVQNSCVSCHGGNLEGGSAPAIDKAGAKYSEDEILEIIENGKGGMPGGIIKGDDAKAVASYLADKK